MDIRAAIVEANTINIVQSGSHAILKMQDEVESFVRPSASGLSKKRSARGLQTPLIRAQVAMLHAPLHVPNRGS